MNWGSYENQKLFKNKEKHIGILLKERGLGEFAAFYFLLDVKMITNTNVNSGVLLTLMDKKRIFNTSFVYTPWNENLEVIL
jgi:hypothetical protein